MPLQDILFIASIVFFVLAFILIALAVIVFFVRNIPDVRADLSGKKRAEEVARIVSDTARGRRRGGSRREAGVGAGATAASSGNVGVRKVAATQSSASGSQPRQAAQGQQRRASEPARSAQQAAKPKAVRVQPAAPVPARETADTTILPDDDQSTTILPDDDNATTILPDDASSTTILPENGEAAASSEGATAGCDPEPFEHVEPTLPIDFTVVRRIEFMHSGEFIRAEQGD